jgi:hypothetical protein
MPAGERIASRRRSINLERERERLALLLLVQRGPSLLGKSFSDLQKFTIVDLLFAALGRN